MIHDKKNFHYMGVRIDNVNHDNISETIKNILRESDRAYICVNDVASIIMANQDNGIFQAINSSVLSIADGTPLAWFGKLVGYRDMERISGMDLMQNLFTDKEGFRHYLLGDTTATIDKVIEKAREMNSDIRIEGHSPPFKEFDEEDNRFIMEKLNKAKPDIIWVSLGGGKQDKWMHTTIKSLDRGVMIGVGAAFRWFTGDLVTPPKIVQKMGLQWVYRIAHYLAENPVKNLKFVVGTVLRRNMLFVLNFPGEVIKARREYRGKTAGPGD